jgi:hypothetical protein
MIDENLARLRAHRNNIHRYRRLLDTRLSEIEREFIARRLSEEEVAAKRLIDSTFPVNLQPHMTPTPTTLVAAVERPSTPKQSEH